MSFSRRDLLKVLGVTTVAGSTLRLVPLNAAVKAHSMVNAEKSAAGSYMPKFFPARQY